jgi:hypothetical protein
MTYIIYYHITYIKNIRDLLIMPDFDHPIPWTDLTVATTPWREPSESLFVPEHLVDPPGSGKKWKKPRNPNSFYGWNMVKLLISMGEKNVLFFFRFSESLLIFRAPFQQVWPVDSLHGAFYGRGIKKRPSASPGFGQNDSILLAKVP